MQIFFYAKYQNSKIIVVTEIGVEVYGRDGDIIKKIPTDLITSFHFTPLSLDCQTDSGIVTINLM